MAHFLINSGLGVKRSLRLRPHRLSLPKPTVPGPYRA
ncbi:MAG: hypothetical protein JWN63_2440, partial [Candidatus Acidoferrum typicum]|nr:hypothetical protein [Candidatus Acidoferrum typicum]